MEYLIIILVVSMLYFVVSFKDREDEKEWHGEDLDGGFYGKKVFVEHTKAVKKRTRKSTKRVKPLPKTVKKKTTKKKTKRKTKKK